MRVMLSKSRDESKCTGAYQNPINRHVTELEPPNESSDYTQFKRSIYKPDTRKRFHEEKKKSWNPLVKTHITLTTVTGSHNILSW